MEHSSLRSSCSVLDRFRIPHHQGSTHSPEHETHRDTKRRDVWKLKGLVFIVQQVHAEGQALRNPIGNHLHAWGQGCSSRHNVPAIGDKTIASSKAPAALV